MESGETSARFWMMTTLCLAVIGGILFDRLASRLAPPRLASLARDKPSRLASLARDRRAAAAAVVSVCVLADGWVTDFPLAKRPVVWQVEACAAAPRDEALMELPLGDPFDDVAAMYRAMSHGHALVNGYSGYFPPHYAALRFGLGLRDQDVLTQLAAYGANLVAIDTVADPDGCTRTTADSQ